MQFALPVPVTSAINPIFARTTMLLIANHMIIVSAHPPQFLKRVEQTAPRLEPVRPSVCRSCNVSRKPRLSPQVERRGLGATYGNAVSCIVLRACSSSLSSWWRALSVEVEGSRASLLACKTSH